MNYNSQQRAGRCKLTLFLVLNLVLAAVSPLAQLRGLPPSPALYTMQLLPLLPVAVILWGIWRGSFPALVIFVISAVNLLGGVLEILQFNGPEALNPDTAIQMIILLVKMTTILSIFRYAEISEYWSARRYAHTKKALILEIILLVVALLLANLPTILLFLYRG